MINKKTGSYSVYLRMKNPETNLFKMFVFKGGVNREKNLDLRQIKAEKLREKIIRLLENGLNPFLDKEDFKNITF